MEVYQRQEADIENIGISVQYIGSHVLSDDDPSKKYVFNMIPFHILEACLMEFIKMYEHLDRDGKEELLAMRFPLCNMLEDANRAVVSGDALRNASEEE